MTVNILEQAFDPWRCLSEYQALNHAGEGKFGATSVFVGTMRDFNEGVDVSELFLEHYPEMTLAYLNKISATANEKWQLLDSLIIHRVGEIKPNDSIVLVATWSTHRDEAYQASRYILEELKHKAPFWKKEKLRSDGSYRWVTKNT